MKKFYLLLSFLGLACSLNAQDVILKTNGDEIQAKVDEIGTNEIKYRRFDNLSGPVYSLPKTEYQRERTVTNNTPAPNQNTPNRDVSFSLPANNIGINVGVLFKF